MPVSAIYTNRFRTDRQSAGEEILERHANDLVNHFLDVGSRRSFNTAENVAIAAKSTVSMRKMLLIEPQSIGLTCPCGRLKY